MASVDSLCSTTKDPQILSICSCKKSSESLASSMKVYSDSIESDAMLSAKYNADMNAYNLAQSTWDTSHQNKVSDLANEKVTMPCGEDCWGNWHIDSKEGCGLYFKRTCKRDESGVTADIQGWLGENPQPIKPNAPSLAHSAPPSNINIACCSQLFSGITANSVNFDNVSQQCTQQIGSQLASAAAPKVSAIPAKTDVAPTAPIGSSMIQPVVIGNSGPSQKQLLIVGGAVSIVLLLGIIVVVATSD